VEVQDVNLKSTGITPGDEYTFFCEKGTCDYHLEAIFGLRGRKYLETGGYCIVTSCMAFTLTTYYSDEQIQENEMGGSCGMYEGEDKCRQGFGGET